MNKIGLILQREYLTRVKKKSFIIMTFVGPVLIALVMLVPIWLTQVSDETRTVAVIDETQLFTYQLKNEKAVTFEYLASTGLEEAKKYLNEGMYYGVLYIPKTFINIPHNSIRLFTKNKAGFKVKTYITSEIRREYQQQLFNTYSIDTLGLNKVHERVGKVALKTFSISETGTETNDNTEISMALGFAGAFMIYFFIFLYGVQVMRGVIEEKTNRIIEIIISSVKPFQLMLGKIIGVALVGLTQFILWIGLSLIVMLTIQAVVLTDRYDTANISQIMQQNIQEGNFDNIEQAEALAGIFETIGSINFPVIIVSFIFYFLGGYLLYSALFAAIGAASDTDTDTQQFMLPITIPLVLSIVMAQFIIENPHGPVAFWGSVIPLTSPIVMMVRIPFGVPYWEIALSMSMLILGFIASTWIAGKIYRIGILMYGKKVSYRELFKWLRY